VHILQWEESLGGGYPILKILLTGALV